MRTRTPLKDGRLLEIRTLRSLSEERYSEIAELFRHKRHYLGHLEDFRAKGSQGRLEGLEWRIYVGLIEEKIVGTVCTWESGGYGILGHVFTLPDYRRLGVARAILEFQNRDFSDRSGKVMQLNTGFQSNAYYLYRSFGFVDTAGRFGSMVQMRTAQEWEKMYRKSPTRTTPLRWKHWTTLNLLFLTENPSYVRCAGMGVYGSNSIEGWFSLNPARIGESGSHGKERIEVLLTSRQVAVGWASLLADPNHEGKSRRLVFDLFLHPRFERDASRLVHRFTVPRGTLAYSTPEDPKNRYLEEMGFRETAILPRYFENGLSLQLFEKRTGRR